MRPFSPAFGSRSPAVSEASWTSAQAVP
jgi:hypothetical protein